MSNLRTFSEEQLWELIEAELKGLKRWTVVERLHMRVCVLRSTRERKELMKRFTGLVA
jgi:hypothetical protein